MYLEEQKNLQNNKLHVTVFFYLLQFLNKNNVKEEITEFVRKSYAVYLAIKYKINCYCVNV